MRKAAIMMETLILFILILFVVGIIMYFVFPFMKDFFAYINETIFGKIFDALERGIGF